MSVLIFPNRWLDFPPIVANCYGLDLVLDMLRFLGLCNSWANSDKGAIYLAQLNSPFISVAGHMGMLG